MENQLHFNQHINGVPDWIINLDTNKILLRGKLYFLAKRILDVAIILLASPLIVPLLVIAAIAIKIESPDGPITYAQLRTGRNGHLFKMYKFRTMIPNAEFMKEKYAHLNELQWPDFKITDDPRVTKVGKILRKTSIDELPQALNVLIGNMSIVGPRPTDFGPEDFKIWHTQRFDVLPGITGIWQIYARATSELDERLRLDILYVNKRCILLDIGLLFLTIPAVLKAKGAS